MITCAPSRSAASAIFRPVSSGVALIAVAAALENPAWSRINANGAEWAPSAVSNVERRVASLAAPIPGTWVSARYAVRSSSTGSVLRLLQILGGTGVRSLRSLDELPQILLELLDAGACDARDSKDARCIGCMQPGELIAGCEQVSLG